MRARPQTRSPARVQAALSLDGEQGRAMLARAREGEATALGELLAGARDRALTLCCRLLGERAEAEDAAQEALLKVALHLHELHDEEQFTNWCWRIAHRISMDRLRTRHRREKLLAEKREPAPDDSEQRSVGRMLVREILAAMPEDMSEALILREMEGETYAEIGRRLALPLGTVKSRLSAARKRFRCDYLRAMQEESR